MIILKKGFEYFWIFLKLESFFLRILLDGYCELRNDLFIFINWCLRLKLIDSLEMDWNINW